MAARLSPRPDGNISIRLDSRRILTSPTNISKGLMSPDDLWSRISRGENWPDAARRRAPVAMVGAH